MTQLLRSLQTHLRFYFSHMALRPVYKTNCFILNLFLWNTVGLLEVKIFISRSDYIAHTHMHAQSHCRKIHMRAYFILGYAGINLKICVWKRSRRGLVSKRYIAVALLVALAVNYSKQVSMRFNPTSLTVTDQ